MVERGVRWIGQPLDVVRATDSKYLDAARLDLRSYVSRTLTANQSVGGRYNAPGEFGVLYTASDADTAWAELAARFRREGIPGLPPRMGLLGLVVRAGWMVDLTDARMQDYWDVAVESLQVPAPNPAQVTANRALGRSVRPVADVLACPSARAGGVNFAIFAEREGGALQLELRFAMVTPVPAHLAQVAEEEW